MQNNLPDLDTLSNLLDRTEQLANTVTPPKKKGFFDRFQKPQTDSEPVTHSKPTTRFTLLSETLGFTFAWMVVLAIAGKGRFNPAFLILLSSSGIACLIWMRRNHLKIERIAQFALSFVLALGFIQLFISLKS